MKQDRNTKKSATRNTENRTKNSLGKEKVGDKLGKNQPQRLTRTATGMKGSMSKANVRKRAR